MQKVNRIIQRYLLVSFPFVIVMMIWGTIQPESEVTKSNSVIIKTLWEILAWNLMAWFAVLIVFLISLIFVPQTRENILSRLANIKERDEREEFITGRAAKSAHSTD